MPSKRRQRRKSCEGKTPYPSHTAAAAAARWRSRQTRSWIRPYKCQFGRHWHIGHPPRKVRRAIAAAQRG